MIPDYWRDLPYIFQGFADKCSLCGYLNYPHRKICVDCGKGTEFERVKLPTEGVIYSYVINYFTPSIIDSPEISVIVDLGVRKVYGLLVDCAPKEVYVGMGVEMVTRIIKVGEGYSCYGTKFRRKEKIK